MNSFKASLAVLALLISSCATTPSVPPQTPAQITAEASAVVVGAYLLVPVANQTTFVSYARDLVAELRLITSGNLPVPSVLEQDLLNSVPSSDQFIVQSLIVGLSGIYSIEYPKIAGNHPVVVADINALATGIEQGLPLVIAKRHP